jgi:molybdopterin synthase catalytic subunit
MVELTDRALEPAALAGRLRTPRDGATVIFVGTVRDQARGHQVIRLDYEAFAPMALEQMRSIEREVRARWPITDVALVHRTGSLRIGEASVLVAVTAPHRKEAFDACQHGIDTLKATVPIWKKEYYIEGEAWVDDRP